MRVKYSYDEGATFEAECDLRECYPDDDDAYQEALRELKASGRYWEGGGAAALVLIVATKT